MTDNENKIDALKGKMKKLEGSRNLIAGLFVLLGYYIFDSYREGNASFFYYIIIGSFMAVDLALFVYVSLAIHKLAAESEKIENSALQ